MTITTSPLSDALGARIHGLDPARVDAADRASLRESFLEYGVLLAKGLADMDARPAHRALRVSSANARSIPFPTIRLKGHPEIIVLAAELGDTLAEDDPSREEIVGQIPWHSDLTYTDSPSRGSLLLARVVPPELGRTGFIDTAAVYDALPEDLRARIEGRRGIHSLGPIQEALKSAAQADDEMEGGEAPAFEQVVHPLVHAHPESGRRVLNVSPAFIQRIEGLPEEESRGLLDELIAFATQDRFVYLHQWEVGDLLIWTIGGRCTSRRDTRRSTHAECTGRRWHRGESRASSRREDRAIAERGSVTAGWSVRTSISTRAS